MECGNAAAIGLQQLNRLPIDQFAISMIIRQNPLQRLVA